MQSFISLTSAIVPINRSDIDTDQIIPGEYLASTGPGAYGKGLFKRLREQDDAFSLNQEKYRDANILVVGKNFGCGSSREHAVWALLEYGFRVVIAPSFADIFHSNAAKNGLVTVQLPEEVINKIISEASDGDYQVTVDLANQIISLPDGSEHAFPFDAFRKECILKGYDDLDYLLEHKTEIENWQEKMGQGVFFRTTGVQ